jgi:hypothetical protein
MRTNIHWCGLAQKEVSISEPRSSGVYFVTTNRCSRFRMPTDAAAFSSYSDHSPSERSISTNFVPVNCIHKETNHRTDDETLLPAIHPYASSAFNNVFNKSSVLIHNRHSKQSIISRDLGLQYRAPSRGLVPFLDIRKHYMQLHRKNRSLVLNRLDASAVETSDRNEFAAFAVLESIRLVPSGNHCDVSLFVTELALHRRYRNWNIRSNEIPTVESTVHSYKTALANEMISYKCIVRPISTQLSPKPKSNRQSTMPAAKPSLIATLPHVPQCNTS